MGTNENEFQRPPSTRGAAHAAPARTHARTHARTQTTDEFAGATTLEDIRGTLEVHSRYIRGTFEVHQRYIRDIRGTLEILGVH